MKITVIRGSGTSLSGGLDSSSIAAIIKTQTQIPKPKFPVPNSGVHRFPGLKRIKLLMPNR
jgi:asparagine synthetase B (glutamine-hydrolysing)